MQDSGVHVFFEKDKFWSDVLCFIEIKSKFFVSFLLKKKFKNKIPIKEKITEA